MEIWSALLDQYSLLSNTNEKLLREQKWLDEKYCQKCNETDLIWNAYSDKEKRIKRIKDSLSYQKTKGYNRGEFELEDSIIDLYESIECCLTSLDRDYSELAIRLRAHLFLVKKTINCFRDIRSVKNDYFLNELLMVVADCLSSNWENYFIEKINILYLKSKIVGIQKLKEQGSLF